MKKKHKEEKERIIDVTTKGLSPLLMARCDLPPNEKDFTTYMDKEREKEKNMSPEEFCEYQFKKKQFRTADGKLYLPAWHMMEAIIYAGKLTRVKGRKRATYSGSRLVGVVIVEPPKIIHKITKLEKFNALAVNVTRKRFSFCRPMLKEWEVDFQLIFDPKKISKGVLKTILDRAGRRVGVGDRRAQKREPYGRFVVTKFELRN